MSAADLRSAASAPMPPITADTEEWWDATRERRLMIQVCENGHRQLYPRVICAICGSLELILEQATGEAKVYSFTVIARSPNPDLFTSPYIVALVHLAEGPLLLTNITGRNCAAVVCDEPVHLTWVPLADGRHLPQFVRTEDKEE